MAAVPDAATERAALDADYARAGFGGRLSFGGRPALVVIDLVQAYLDPASPLYAGAQAEAVLKSNVRLIEAARAARTPVIYTVVVYGAGGADGGLFYRKVPALKAFDAGSPLGRFPPQIAPGADEVVVVKQYASAFFGTSLASTLRALQVDTVVMGGFSTSGCVRASALDALQHGFAPFVVREACGDRAPPPHEANLFDLQAKYAEVISEARALTQLRDGARAVGEVGDEFGARPVKQELQPRIEHGGPHDRAGEPSGFGAASDIDKEQSAGAVEQPLQGESHPGR